MFMCVCVCVLCVCVCASIEFGMLSTTIASHVPLSCME